MRVVLDTNILISALISHSGMPYQCLKLWDRGHYRLVTSSWQIEELRDVTRRDVLKPYIKRVEVGKFVNEMRKKAIVQQTLPTIDVSPDPDDNNIIATAIVGEANYIVSGDKEDVLALDKIESIRILTARKFVGLFNSY